MIPKGWRRSTLGDIAQVTSGGTPDRSKPEYWGGSIRWVTTGEIKFNTVTDSAEKITEVGLKKSAAKLFPPGTLLMAMYGQGKTRGQVAKLGIDATTNQACAAILLKEGFDPDFYLNYLASQYEAIRGLGNEGTQKNLNGGIIKGIPVPVPPYPEQRAISRILGSWDKAIETTEKLIANSKAQKKALMDSLLGKRKRLPGFTGTWGRSIFEKLFRTANNKSKQIDSAHFLESGKVPVVDQGKALIAGYAETDSPYTDVPVIVFGDHTRIVKWVDFPFVPGADGTQVLKATDTLDPLFAYFLLSHVPLPNLGYSRHMRELKQREFNYPRDRVEQKAIARTLRNAEDLVAQQEHLLQSLLLQKRALMQQLLTGKRRVKLDSAA